MMIPKITILKKKAIIKQTVKSLIKPEIKQASPSTNPLFLTALTWTGKSPRERLHLQMNKLAALAEHGSPAITQSDYEKAKREVTGESILSRQNAILDPVI